MKHKTLRTLLCVILTVCFCLSAIVPASAAGLFGGESGIASQWDQWIRSLKDLKDRIIEKNPGTDETPAEPMAGTGEEFIRIFHLDCGRKYFSVEQIEAIIDQLAANNYTHIELAIGNDGFRFLLDEKDASDKDITFYNDGKKDYTLSEINTAIHNANVAYCQYSDNKYELTQNEMDSIINYASGKGIGVIPLLNIPGHTNTLVNAMSAIGAPVSAFTSNNNSKGYPTQSFNVLTEGTAEFVIAFVKKYVDYFAGKGCTYFNFGADECGYDNFSKEQYTALASMLTNIVSYIKANNMTPMMFNDGLRSTNSLADSLASNKGIAVCFWEMQTSKNYYTAEQLKSKGFTVINTHNKWYYVAGNGNSTSKNWSDWAYHYDYAQEGIDTYGCKSVDGGGTADKGCMLAYWCDNPTASYDATEKGRVFELIERLKLKNDTIFTAPETPTITASKTSLVVGDTATLSVSTGANATWTSSNTEVLEVVAATTRAVENTSSVTVAAVGVGTATVSATLDNGTVFTSDTITVSATRGDEEFDREITVSVGGTANDTILNVNETLSETEYTDGNGTVIAKVSAVGKAATEGETTYALQRSLTYSQLAQLAGNSSSYAKADGYYYLYDGKYHPVYAYISTGNWTVYYYGYKINDTGTVQYVDSSNWGSRNVSGVYKGTKTDPTPASTTVTFTGVAVGTTYATVAGVRYKITVTAEDLSNVSPLPIQTWITNYTVQTPNATTNNTSENYWAANWNTDYDAQKYARYVNVSAADVYGENGKAIADFMPNNITGYEYGGTYWNSNTYDTNAQAKKLVVWNGQVHSSSNIQKIYGKDYSNTGTEFKYVRYYAGIWEVSATGEKGSWTRVDGSNSQLSEQLAVYYMIRSTITDEVTTDVADWGYVKNDDNYAKQISAGSYVMLDFAVKYEDGTRNPNTFPRDGKTFVFHCNTGDSSGAVQQDSSGNYYRRLNNFRAVNTSDYEVYMVTVTMTSDSASEAISDTTNYSYTDEGAGQEKLIWAIDKDTWTNSELPVYTAITSGDTTYSFDETKCIGGDPYVRGVEVYNEHGALITYYVRAKTGALTVHYHDRTRNDQEFYNYNIVVSAGTFFDPNFRQKAPNSLELENHIVKNKYNVDQAVSADLITMRGIPAQYRYSKYTCVKVELVTPDGAGGPTEVHLYYTFSADVSFVVDFGLPLTIPYTELNENLKNEEVKITSITASSPVFGSVTVNGTSGITYTPNKTLDQIDSFKVKCTGTIPVKSEDGTTTTYQEGTVEYTVHIIPATNVYYEETFITNPENSGWTNTATADSVEQTLEKSGNKQNVYGFDTKIEDYYLGDVNSVGKGITYSMGNALTTTLSVPAGAKEAISEKPLTFSFKGTGFDLISECSDKTGILLVYIKGTKLNENGKPYQGVFLVDTYFAGDNAPEGSTPIMKNGTTVYQVPVVREFGAFNEKYNAVLKENTGLPYDTYQVSVYAYLNNNAGVFDNNAAAVASYSAVPMSDSSIIADALAACNITDIDADQVKLVYMDENSILNGGTGAVAEQSAVSMASLYAATVDSAEVYVDAFRVYNPLGDTTVQISNEKFNPAEKNEVQTYKDDKESGVKYMSLYDFVVGNLGSYGNEADGTSSSVYVEYDGNKPASTQIVGKEYKVHGPENEIYLDKNCGIAFHIDQYSDGQTIQISAKAVYGSPTLNGVDVTATEMYYDLANPNISQAIQGEGTGRDIVIFNNGEGVLAISGLKCSTEISISANTSATQAAIKTIRYAMSAKEVSYAPATFEITAPETARRNRSIGIGVTATAADVDSMKIQVTCDGVVVGEETILYPYNVKAVEQGKATNYYYSKSYRFSKAGTYVFTATASDGNGNSYSIEKTVVVK